MTPKILLINASPRMENSANIAEHITKKFKDKADFETLHLGKVKLNFCVACGWCKNKSGHCVKDDELDQHLKRIDTFEGVVIISPVYMGGMTGQAKTFIDRTVSLRRADFILKDKVGAAIAIGASRNGGQELVIQDIHAGMHINGMLVVGDNNHFGGTAHSPFNEDEFGQKTVNETIEKVIETILKLKN